MLGRARRRYHMMLVRPLFSAAVRGGPTIGAGRGIFTAKGFHQSAVFAC